MVVRRTCEHGRSRITQKVAGTARGGPEANSLDVGSDEFAHWMRVKPTASLIHADHGFTRDRVLSRYPDLKSIRDPGSLLSSPWRKSFFPRLGAQRTLDWGEHEPLRPRDHDVRVHFAVNCASIGCPALRPEPYVAECLDGQLDDPQRRCLTDRSRNRFNAARGELAVSSIFKWYGEDFVTNGAALRGWLTPHASLAAMMRPWAPASRTVSSRPTFRPLTGRSTHSFLDREPLHSHTGAAR